MKEHVVGFRITPTNKVLLVHPNKPSWQRRLFNGVGDKIREGETPTAAIERVYSEITGEMVRDWDHFATILGPYTRLFVFRSIGDAKENDNIMVLPISQLKDDECSMDVKWLISYAQLPVIKHVKVEVEPTYKVI